MSTSNSSAQYLSACVRLCRRLRLVLMFSRVLENLLSLPEKKCFCPETVSAVTQENNVAQHRVQQLTCAVGF